MLRRIERRIVVTHSISLKECVKILEHNAEESGTLAILFSEVTEETNELRDVKIFAIDVDTRVIEQAGKDFYGKYSGGCFSGTSGKILYKKK